MRRVRFLEPMTAAILSNGRRHGAFGVAGGAPGRRGVNRVERADGSVEALGHIGSVEMQPGDVFVIETPGGGGYGDRRPPRSKPPSRAPAASTAHRAGACKKRALRGAATISRSRRQPAQTHCGTHHSTEPRT